MSPHSQRIRYDRECRIHCRTRREEAAVHHVKVVEVVRLAVHVERGSFGIVPEADGAVLVRDSGQWDTLSNVKIAAEEAFVAVVSMHRAGVVLHRSFSLDWSRACASKLFGL